jgi:hypothetical protein
MSVHFRARYSVLRRQQTTLAASLGTALAMLALAGCAAAPSTPFAGPDPSDPATRVAAVGYRSTIAPYASRRPVEPKPWQEQNIQVAPEPRR